MHLNVLLNIHVYMVYPQNKTCYILMANLYKVLLTIQFKSAKLELD